MLTIELLALIAAIGAGAFGAVVGVGGGIILVPVLTLFFGVPVQHAAAVSLLGVIAVSTTASASYLDRGFIDRRVAMTLLVATVLGGIAGATSLAFSTDARSALCLASFWSRPPSRCFAAAGRSPRSRARQLASSFDSSYVEPTTGDAVPYRARRVGPSAFVSVFAGALSGLLGIGGGIVNVPTMNVLMGIPIRVATTTSTYMLGATAAASSVLYLSRGEVDFALAAPVVIGVFLGGRVGAIFQPRVPQQALSLAFVVLALFFAVQMLIRVVGG